jgi:hypothetical protein
VDLWLKGKGKTFDHYNSEETWRIFNEQIQSIGVAHIVNPVMMGSVPASKKRKNPIHLLFIDANHKYQYVLQDFKSWEKFIPSGGCVAFHDYGTRFPGVDQVIQEEVIDSGNWTDYQVHHRIWSAVRK